ncbi:MAG: polyprenyl synthetase family protein [Neomegalonema sp.]|nr:polyprenyl synthetase family protein [Neomegalonema sp.]
MGPSQPEAQPSAASQAGAYERLRALVAEDLEAVNGLIRSRMVSEQAPLIAELASHLIEAGGKRLRPILTLAAARLCGYEGAHHQLLAATVEFIHTATLLHDDVVDESARRRGKESANILWGNKPSVLVGDFLFSRSFQLMVETGSIRVLEILSTASAVIAEGEVLQLASVNTLADDDDIYMRVIRAKTAALFEAATQVGGVIAGVDPEAEAALAQFGAELGVAFQLVDDVLDYGGADARLGKSIGDDFREGKATLPVLLAYRKGDEPTREFWRRVIVKRKQEEGDLEHALVLLEQADALTETAARAREHIAIAKRALERFPQTPLRQALEDVSDFVVARTL